MLTSMTIVAIIYAETKPALASEKQTHCKQSRSDAPLYARRCVMETELRRCDPFTTNAHCRYKVARLRHAAILQRLWLGLFTRNQDLCHTDSHISHTMLPFFCIIYYTTLSSLHGKTLGILTTGSPLSKSGKRRWFYIDFNPIRSNIAVFDNGISVVKIRWYLRKKAPSEWTTPFLMYCYVGCKGE